MNKLIAILALVVSACAAPGAPKVVLTGGAVAGEVSREGAVFRGIPFASPPVGERRWRAPQPPEPWQGTFQATDFAPACMQGDYNIAWYAGVIAAFGGDPALATTPNDESEDCLYLNVWTPDLDATGLPVMVWIHGGGYQGGWSYEQNYIGENLSKRGVVVVSIAYRLGAFGYFGPDGRANFGLKDQIAALEWVRDNIAAFGGDPGNVTLFGESAGAASIGTLIVTPSARGLFQRAIHQSGGFEFVNNRTTEETTAAFTRLAGALAPASPIDASTQAVFDAAKSALADYDYAPVADGDLLLVTPRHLLLAGEAAGVDLMIGTNQDEWLMYLDTATAEQQLTDWRERMPGASAIIDQIMMESGLLGTLDRLQTADQMRCPGRELASSVSRAGGRVFAYRFTRVRPGKTAPELGSYHGAEIPYVFDTHDDWLPTDDADRALTETMMSAWVAFATTGDPNPIVDWPEFAETGQVLALGDTIRPVSPLDDRLCAYLGGAAMQGETP